MPVIISPQTAAVSQNVDILSRNIPASLVLDIDVDFAGAETIPVFYVGADKTRKTPVLDADGVPFAFSLTSKALPLYFPCKLRLEKPVSVMTMGVNQFLAQ